MFLSQLRIDVSFYFSLFFYLLKPIHLILDLRVGILQETSLKSLNSQINFILFG
jgi:hypothetical protein